MLQQGRMLQQHVAVLMAQPKGKHMVCVRLCLKQVQTVQAELATL
jgi:hypothetical protein